MEFRTSPGKMGSVQHVSVCLMDVVHSCLVLVSRLVGRDGSDFSSNDEDGCVQQGQIARWEERISPRPLPPSFCPGCLASPVV